MMKEENIRTAMLIGEDGCTKLENAHVAVFGVGGVGGYVVEALARAGVGTISLIDHDIVSISNINRQMIALHSTVGRKKVEVMKERIQDINPDAKVILYDCFYLPEECDQFDFTSFDYIIDAIDTVTAKIDLIVQANRNHVPVISAMGAGNKLDPGKFEITDIYKTSVCPLAKVMRRELKKREIPSLKVVYSKEIARKPLPITIENSAKEITESQTNDQIESPTDDSQPVQRKQTPGSISFVPAVAGLMIAGEVIRDLTGETKDERKHQNTIKYSKRS